MGWLIKDLETVVARGSVASLSHALLHRIVREAAQRFQVPDGGLTVDFGDDVTQGNGTLAAVIAFETVKLKDGAHPRIAMHVRRKPDCDRVEVRVGVDEGASGPGWTVAVDLTDETPAELFFALFACALESAQNNGRVTGRVRER